MPKRPLSNVSNNYQIQNNNLQKQSTAASTSTTTSNLKRGIDQIENVNSSSKKPKNINDVDQENEKSSVFKKILSVNNRIIENITNSNLKTSIYKKKDSLKEVKNVKLNLNKQFNDQQLNANNNKIKNEPEFTKQDKDKELIENLYKNLQTRQEELKKCFTDFANPINYYEQPKDLPDDIDDYDLKNIHDINAEAQFAFDIFEYYSRREKQFQIKDYINEQTEISRSMRAILGKFFFSIFDF